MPKLVGIAYEALVRDKGRHLLRVRQENALSIDVGDYQRKRTGAARKTKTRRQSIYPHRGRIGSIWVNWSLVSGIRCAFCESAISREIANVQSSRTV